jgi:fructosamine-3-kinase
LTLIESILNEKIVSSKSIGGGCIADSRKITTESGREFFLKSGNKGNRMFHCEANGLKELAKAQCLRVPQVVAVADDFLLLEYIPQGNRSQYFFEEFGKNFAKLHRFQADKFGFYEDNYIGATPQQNIPDKAEEKDWVAFYFNKRLLFQYYLAEKNGYVTPRMKNAFSKLESKIASILQGSEELPCLLHGDLWSGNYLCDETGRAVLIDPAVYYGHREADLAMTKLFGGFSPAFYEAYHCEYPLSDRLGIPRKYLQTLSRFEPFEPFWNGLFV